jgi:hypothetical protein
MNTTPIASDAKVESIDYSENTVDLAQLPPDEEARLRRIFDVNLLPPLAFMSVRVCQGHIQDTNFF